MLVSLRTMGRSNRTAPFAPMPAFKAAVAGVLAIAGVVILAFAARAAPSFAETSDVAHLDGLTRWVVTVPAAQWPELVVSAEPGAEFRGSERCPPDPSSRCLAGVASCAEWSARCSIRLAGAGDAEVRRMADGVPVIGLLRILGAALILCGILLWRNGCRGSLGVRGAGGG